ncbi:MAG: efflux RND transporter periplasmic adaptor subunit [Treponema sp.]|nr:efflux RND transporter periplasmic adaptor subunit [Treponema sp.]
MKKKIIIVAAILIVTAIAIFVINKTKPAGGAGFGGPGKGGRGGNITFTVRSAEAKVETLNGYVITNGEVETQSSIEIFPSMGGKIASVDVMLGSHVKKGDVIGKIDPSEPGTKFALSPIEAPISGSILSSPLKVGTKVSTGTVITMIGDIENLQVKANVPERYVAELKPGLKAEIQLEAYPDVVFKATVSRVSPVVDKLSRTKEILLNFDKKDSRVNAGMFAKIKLYTSKYAGCVVVSKDGLVQDEDNVYLFVVNDDMTVSKRSVKIGKTVDSMVQVTDNLMPGERVVVEGVLSLSEGAKVIDIAMPRSE